MPPARPRVKTVETIDDVDGLEEDAARTLSRRLWYLGWCGLPLLWAMNAYLFYPHVRRDDDDAGGRARHHLDVDGEGSSEGSSSEEEEEEEEEEDAPRRARAVAVKDVVVARYAGLSLAGAKVAGGILLAWAATFALGGFERAFGEERWRALALSSWIEM